MSIANGKGLQFAHLPISYLIYNLLFHPPPQFPGPVPWRASRIPYIAHLFRGDLEKPEVMGKMYEKPGRVVRIAPNILAFADARAWKGESTFSIQIRSGHFDKRKDVLTLGQDLGARKHCQMPNMKELSHFGAEPGTKRGIMTSESEEHA